MKNIKKFNELNTYTKLTNKERINAISELEKFIEKVKDEVSINNFKIMNNMGEDSTPLMEQFDELIYSYNNIKSKNEVDRYTNKLLSEIKPKHYGF